MARLALVVMAERGKRTERFHWPGSGNRDWKRGGTGKGDADGRDPFSPFRVVVKFDYDSGDTTLWVNPSNAADRR